MSVTIQNARNLGPVSCSQLKEIGILTLEDLMQHGAISVYLMLKSEGFSSNLNLLWALMGAVEDRDWRDFSEDEKKKVLDELKSFGV